MRIIICRHGDPDYEHDSLTERGVREAELLSERLVEYYYPSKIYCSPLGRAQLTAKPTVEKTGVQPVTLEWLREYPLSANIFERDGDRGWICPWEVPHGEWYPDAQANDPSHWLESERCAGTGFDEYQKLIRAGIDEMMADRGLVREGDFYRATPKFEKHRDENIHIFCHYGMTLAILAAVLPLSGLTLWNGFSLDSSSVTELITDKVSPDTFILRCMRLGDISHLYRSGLRLGKAPREWWYCDSGKDNGPKV